MAIEAIKKKYPIRDENGQPATYPTFASQVFNKDGVPIETEDGGVLISDSARLGGKAPEYYLSPRNLLDNSDFTNPVNQRGQTSYSHPGVYSIDRWLNWYVVAENESGSFQVNDNYVSLTENFKLEQRLPNYKPNTIYTGAVMKADGEIITVNGIFTQGEVIGENVYLTISVSGYAVFGFRGIGDYLWAALYEGSYTADTLPPYVSKGYAAELAECQRYYFYINSWALLRYRNDTGVNQSLFATGILLYFPNEMRVVPTVTIKYDINDGEEQTTSSYVVTKMTATLPNVTLTASYTFDLHSVEASADL